MKNENALEERFGPVEAPYVVRLDEIQRVPESATFFWRELIEMVDFVRRFACVVVLVPFNEGWGQFNTTRAVDYLREAGGKDGGKANGQNMPKSKGYKTWK